MRKREEERGVFSREGMIGMDDGVEHQCIMNEGTIIFGCQWLVASCRLLLVTYLLFISSS